MTRDRAASSKSDAAKKGGDSPLMNGESQGGFKDSKGRPLKPWEILPPVDEHAVPIPLFTKEIAKERHLYKRSVLCCCRKRYTVTPCPYDHSHWVEKSRIDSHFDQCPSYDDSLNSHFWTHHPFMNLFYRRPYDPLPMWVRRTIIADVLLLDLTVNLALAFWDVAAATPWGGNPDFSLDLAFFSELLITSTVLFAFEEAVNSYLVRLLDKRKHSSFFSCATLCNCICGSVLFPVASIFLSILIFGFVGDKLESEPGRLQRTVAGFVLSFVMEMLTFELYVIRRRWRQQLPQLEARRPAVDALRARIARELSESSGSVTETA